MNLTPTDVLITRARAVQTIWDADLAALDTGNVLDLLGQLAARLEAASMHTNALAQDCIAEAGIDSSGSIKKITAIKFYREMTGCRLKEAKDAIETELDG